MVGVAAAVRCYQLDKPFLSNDESFSWRLTQYSAEELCRRTGADVHPPLHYLILKIWAEVFGDSLCSLRGLSVLLGISAVLILYVACLEILQNQAASPQKTWVVVDTGALFAALVFALSSAQVDASRTARMYSLGVFFAGLTAWLLLRACRSQETRWCWWTGYGTAAALFCYTHNYAFFTLFGQGLFVGGSVLFSRRAARPANPARIFLGFSYAALLAFVLYLPWVPVLLDQVRRVKLDYWMQQVDVWILERTLFTFGTGLPFEGAWSSLIWVGLLAGAMALAIWRGTNAALFFLAQAFAPLVLSAALSLASGRSIFHEHLFVFAQLSLVAFWAVLWTALPGWLERFTLAVLLVGAASVGLAAKLANTPQNLPAIAAAAAFLKATAHCGDEVWTSSAWELNGLRYYLAQAGAKDLKVRCRHYFPGKEQMDHTASVLADEFIWAGAEPVQPPNRLWLTGNECAPRVLTGPVLEREFGTEGSRKYSLRLFEARRQKDVPEEQKGSGFFFR